MTDRISCAAGLFAVTCDMCRAREHDATAGACRRHHGVDRPQPRSARRPCRRYSVCAAQRAAGVMAGHHRHRAVAWRRYRRALVPIINARVRRSRGATFSAFGCRLRFSDSGGSGATLSGAARPGFRRHRRHQEALVFDFRGVVHRSNLGDAEMATTLRSMMDRLGRGAVKVSRRPREDGTSKTATSKRRSVPTSAPW